MRLRPRHVTLRITPRANVTSSIIFRCETQKEVGQRWTWSPHYDVIWDNDGHMCAVPRLSMPWHGEPVTASWAPSQEWAGVSGHWESELWTPGPSSVLSQGRDAGCCGVQWAHNHGVTASQIEQRRSVSMSDLSPQSQSQWPSWCPPWPGPASPCVSWCSWPRPWVRPPPAPGECSPCTDSASTPTGPRKSSPSSIPSGGQHLSGLKLLVRWQLALQCGASLSILNLNSVCSCYPDISCH